MAHARSSLFWELKKADLKSEGICWMKMKRWMDQFNFLARNVRNNNQQFQLNKFKMCLRAPFRAKLFRGVSLQVFLNQILLVEKNLQQFWKI